MCVVFVCVSMQMLLPAQSKKTRLNTKGTSGNSVLESHLFRLLLACSLTEINGDYGMACRYVDVLLLHLFKRSREMTTDTGLRLLVQQSRRRKRRGECATVTSGRVKIALFPLFNIQFSVGQPTSPSYGPPSKYEMFRHQSISKPLHSF